MKKILNSGLVLTLLALGSLSAAAQNLLYITDVNGKFGTVNLDTDKVTVLGTSGVVLHDIGFTSNGNLYGDTFTDLYTVNVTDGATNLVGGFNGAGYGKMVGLTGNGTSLIAGSIWSKQIYLVDVAPTFSVHTLSGSLGGFTNGDLTFGANGALYDVLTTGVLDKITINGSSFTATAVGNTNDPSVSGMATDAAGQTFVVSGTEIYTVDLNTAVLTPFFNYAGHGLSTVTGSAIPYSSQVVPEPGTISLLLAGLAALLAYQKRRVFARVD